MLVSYSGLGAETHEAGLVASKPTRFTTEAQSIKETAGNHLQKNPLPQKKS